MFSSNYNRIGYNKSRGFAPKASPSFGVVAVSFSLFLGIISFCYILFVNTRTVSSPTISGGNGIDCWDINQDGTCDLLVEDVDLDGECTYADCQGSSGSDGLSCWDKDADGTCNLSTEDVNSDGSCNATDCIGPSGLGGHDCWDLDQDRECDLLTEDANGDGACNVTDCKGLNCWDFNGNGRCDLLTEDMNSDGDCNATDCRGLECWDLNGNGACNLLTEDVNSDGACNISDCRGANGLLTNSDISSNANISWTKLATGSPNQVLITNGAGVITSETPLDTGSGGTGLDTSSSVGIPVLNAGWTVTLNPSATTFTATTQLRGTASSSQVRLGVIGTCTLNAVNMSSGPRIYTFQDVGVDANVLLDQGTKNISGSTNFVSTPTFQSLSTGLLHSDSSGVITSTLLLNADVSASAGIVYSKLSLTNSILNADIAAGAAVAYSKLNLALSIVNGDVAAGAAIARDKLAAGTPSQIVANDVSGVLTSVAQVTASQGGTGIDTSSSVGIPQLNSGWAITQNPSATTFTATSQLIATATTNQIKLGSVGTATISAINATAPRTYTIQDAGANANFVMDQGTNVIAGATTFTLAPTITALGAGPVFSSSAGLLSSSQSYILLVFNATFTHNSQGSFIKLPFTSSHIVTDPSGLWNSSSNGINLKKAGLWTIKFHMLFLTALSSCVVASRILVNGAGVNEDSMGLGSSALGPGWVNFYDYYARDTLGFVEVQVFQSCTANPISGNTLYYYPKLSAIYVSP